MAGGLKSPARAGAIALCLLAWLGPSISRARTASARASSSTPLTGVSIGGPGYDSGPAQADRDVARAHQLHAKVVRVEVPWSVMEPLQASEIEPRALAITDRLVKDAATAGIRVIMMVESTPCWASSAPRAVLRKCTAERTGAAGAWPPSQPGDYAAFVAHLAQRYGRELAAIEIWNEPDESNQQYFAGPDKAQRYAAILRAAYPAIKRADPSVAVLAGALVGSNGAFLRALYAAGIRGYYDGLAVHYYNLTIASLRSIHEVQLANGDGTPLWLDEFGWSSCWPGHKIEQEQACVTSRVQASNLADLVHELARVPYVAAAVVYKLQSSNDEDFGLLTAAGARKPAFGALASAIASPLAAAGSVTLSLHSAGGAVVARGSAPPGDYMELEALQGPVLRYWAYFVLDRFNDYSIRLPSALGPGGLTVRVYQAWQGSASAAQRSI
jgi:hypothetical protein